MAAAAARRPRSIAVAPTPAVLLLLLLLHRHSRFIHRNVAFLFPSQQFLLAFMGFYWPNSDVEAALANRAGGQTCEATCACCPESKRPHPLILPPSLFPSASLARTLSSRAASTLKEELPSVRLVLLLHPASSIERDGKLISLKCVVVVVLDGWMRRRRRRRRRRANGRDGGREGRRPKMMFGSKVSGPSVRPSVRPMSFISPINGEDLPEAGAGAQTGLHVAGSPGFGGALPGSTRASNLHLH